ncbi:MAG: hydroxymethylbilane synthase [Ilumatobacter sp.]|nr:hydroxymethylbilane synthase [Ilumatobacter sp.]
MPTLRLATRGSAQAVTQAEHVVARLADVGLDATLVIVETHGDRTQATNVPLHTIGGQGVFVKEVQAAVLDGRADVAVHSAKDLPTETDPGLTIAAWTERRDAADALIGATLDGLSEGATVATGSVRRRAQLAHARPDLEFAELRGNIHTRLERIPDGGAIVMAVAALQVLGITDRLGERLDPAVFVPAVGQGCVALESRLDDADTNAALAAIDHAPTRRAVEIERAFLAELGSGCSLPVGAHVVGDVVTTFLASDDGAVVHRETIELSGDHDLDVATARSAARTARDRVDGR